MFCYIQTQIHHTQTNKQTHKITHTLKPPTHTRATFLLFYEERKKRCFDELVDGEQKKKRREKN